MVGSHVHVRYAAGRQQVRARAPPNHLRVEVAKVHVARHLGVEGRLQLAVVEFVPVELGEDGVLLQCFDVIEAASEAQGGVTCQQVL